MINDLGGAVDTILTTILSPFITFAGPFLVGFVIILFLWIGLCCCCCAGCCCTCSKCCKKNPDQVHQEYTKCELYWPTIVLILAILLTLVAGVVGLTKAGDMQSSTNAVACSLAITLDDLINGNVTTAGTFFIGINPLYTEMINLNNNMGDISGNLSSIGTGGGQTSTTLGDAATAKNAIDVIPDGTPGGNVAGYNYNSPFNANTGTIPSTMPDELGSSTSAGSLVFLAYTEVGVSESQISGIASTADAFGASLGDFNSAIDSVSKTIKDLATTL